ncbi:MAG: glycosyltransferase [Flavobacteriaceae bacterium]|jgi:hypothetical protein|nr:glycosyltransferase [Flavobacteriaceae bacterium]
MKNIILLIPHYNNLMGLKESIKSINKECELVDILVIDDGSNSKLDEESLQSIYDGNLFVINNRVNRGIENVLNDGIAFSIEKNYKYIARLDCGDISLNDRFAKQYRFLEENDNVDIVGAHVSCVNEEGAFLYNLHMPLDNETIKKRMYLNAMLIHPTIFFRTSIVKEIGGYPIDYKSAEDYAFFFKMLRKYNFANIDEVLVQIEINPNGISSQNRDRQVKNRIKLIKENFYVGFYPIYGLIRSLILLYIPQKIIGKIKMFFLR